MNNPMPALEGDDKQNKYGETIMFRLTTWENGTQDQSLIETAKKILETH
jgi:hypothetical protein